MTDRPSAFLDRIEELGQEINLEQLIYARTLNPTSLRDAWARYDRADFMLALACHFGAPLDRRTAARFAIECSDHALLVFDVVQRANLGRYEHLVNAMHKWLDSGYLDRHNVTEGDLREVMALCWSTNSRGPTPALASVLTAWFAAVGAAYAAAVDPAVSLAMACLTALFGVNAARDMPAEQRWQADRLRELLPIP
jgi:hypothetical protein